MWVKDEMDPQIVPICASCNSKRALDWNGRYATSLKPGTAAATRFATTDMARPSSRGQAGFARVQRSAPTNRKVTKQPRNDQERRGRLAFGAHGQTNRPGRARAPQCECRQSAERGVSNSKANRGRAYLTCRRCGFFRWAAAAN